MTPPTPADVVLAQSFAGDLETSVHLAQPSGCAATGREAHSPAPWSVELAEVYSVRDAEDGRIAMLTNLRGRYGMGGRRSANEVVANAARIVACVNAMEGLSNAQVASLRESRDALVRALEDAEMALHGAWQMLYAINENDPSLDRTWAAQRAADGLSKVRAALAAAKERT